MRTSIKIIICASIVQIAIACGAPLSEQCKQIEDIQKASVHVRDSNLSKEFEISAEEYAKQSKSIEKLSISDSNLKKVQQKLVKNYQEAANIFRVSANISRQDDVLDTANQTGRIALARQFMDNSDKLIINFDETQAVISEMTNICTKK